MKTALIGGRRGSLSQRLKRTPPVPSFVVTKLAEESMYTSNSVDFQTMTVGTSGTWTPPARKLLLAFVTRDSSANIDPDNGYPTMDGHGITWTRAVWNRFGGVSFTKSLSIFWAYTGDAPTATKTWVRASPGSLNATTYLTVLQVDGADVSAPIVGVGSHVGGGAIASHSVDLPGAGTPGNGIFYLGQFYYEPSAPANAPGFTMVRAIENPHTAQLWDQIGWKMLSSADNSVTVPHGTAFEDSGIVAIEVKKTPVAVKSFSTSPTYQDYFVPEGITELEVELWGARGGFSFIESRDSNGRGIAGAGAYARGRIAVTPGEILRLYVGGKGGSTEVTPVVQAGGAGGSNGGGAGAGGSASTYPGGGGGGGATDIRRTPYALANRLIVAGGGGGAGGPTTGTWTDNQQGGAGGVAGTNGFQGAYGRAAVVGGGGATQSAGGSAAGAGASAGALGVGGAGGRNAAGSGGGGGGGGYYGGGGGTTQSGSSAGSGGGGGSSYVGGATGGTIEEGACMTDGYAIVRPVVDNQPLHPNIGTKITATLVKSQTGANATATTFDITAVAPAADRLLILAVLCRTSAGNDDFSASGLGLTWTRISLPKSQNVAFQSSVPREKWVFFRAVTGASPPASGNITVTAAAGTIEYGFNNDPRLHLFAFANTKRGSGGANGIVAITQDASFRTQGASAGPLPQLKATGPEVLTFESDLNASFGMAWNYLRSVWDASGPHTEILDDGSSTLNFRQRADFLDRPAKYGVSLNPGVSDEYWMGAIHFELRNADAPGGVGTTAYISDDVDGYTYGTVSDGWWASVVGAGYPLIVNSNTGTGRVQAEILSYDSGKWKFRFLTGTWSQTVLPERLSAGLANGGFWHAHWPVDTFQAVSGGANLAYPPVS